MYMICTICTSMNVVTNQKITTFYGLFAASFARGRCSPVRGYEVLCWWNGVKVPVRYWMMQYHEMRFARSKYLAWTKWLIGAFHLKDQTILSSYTKVWFHHVLMGQSREMGTQNLDQFPSGYSLTGEISKSNPQGCVHASWASFP
jgi:hypothetical protein